MDARFHAERGGDRVWERAFKDSVSGMVVIKIKYSHKLWAQASLPRDSA